MEHSLGLHDDPPPPPPPPPDDPDDPDDPDVLVLVFVITGLACDVELDDAFEFELEALFKFDA
jgi:hypothetical protein